MIINSLQNPKIKNIVSLRKAAKRKKQELFIIDGLREIKVAHDYGFEFDNIFHCPEISNEKPSFFNQEITITSIEVFKKIAYSENPNGWLATVKPRYHGLEDIKKKNNYLFLVLESVEKPGNLGAIIRTAYAANLDAVIINQSQTDLYNPNVIKASSGHVFSSMVVIASKEKSLEWFKKNKVNILATSIKAAKSYEKIDWKYSSAIILGSEAHGLGDFWLNNSNQNIIIPMQQGIDSLNVSVSAGIIAYEAKRQRNLD